MTAIRVASVCVLVPVLLTLAATWLDAATWRAAADAMAGDGRAESLDEATLEAARVRLRWAGSGLAALAVLTLISARTVAAFLITAQRDMGRLRRLGRGHLRRAWRRDRLAIVLVGLFTLLFAVLAGRYLNQTMRTDESASFIAFGTRSPLLPLLQYRSTNNHMLHSLLMRLSVAAFGESPPATRLPAYLAGVACLPLLYLAARVHLGRSVALLAAGAWAGTGYAVDLATNARGYPLLITLFLLLLALLPWVVRRRSAAVVAAMTLGAVGLWVVPIMLYPLTIIGLRASWWAWRRGPRGEPWHRRVRRLSVVGRCVAGTMVLAVLLYLPALVVSGVGGGSTGATLAKSVEAARTYFALEATGMLFDAWEVWTIPLGVWGERVAFALLVLGVGWACVATRRSGALAASTVLGVGALLLATRAVPPRWSMSFLYPVAMMYVAAGGWSVVWVVTRGRWRGRPRVRARVAGAAALALAAAGAGVLLTSDYPARTQYVGLPNAQRVAASVARDFRPGDAVVAEPVVASPMLYYLYRGGATRGEFPRFDPDAPPTPGAATPPTLFVVTKPGVIGRGGILLREQYRQDLTAMGYVLQRRAEVGDVGVDRYTLTSIPEP